MDEPLKSKAFSNDSGAAEYISKALNSDFDAAYAKGWDDAEEAFRGKMADLLELSGARVEQLENALQELQAGMRNHIEAMGTIAPVHPTVYHWKDHVDKVLASPGPSLEHHKEEGDG